ncbi:hypothetical protein B0T24DRAFT_662480 [Lasiosphaeria ovina]|uniref:Uncharacterized protein n=1 Tax=Lasiosphaeria ovina TaxID=92902 RepID=A0AAE0NM99_9PEZI|nr:hypothetical protein B0T24DRAFT_662480 [Lasiosphaeria ovina]
MATSSAAKPPAVRPQVSAASNKPPKDGYPKIIAFELDDVLWRGNLDLQEKQLPGCSVDAATILLDVVDARSKVIIISRSGDEAGCVAQLQVLKSGFEYIARNRVTIPDFPNLTLNERMFMNDKKSMVKLIDDALAKLNTGVKADEQIHATDILMFGNSPSNIEVEVERDVAFRLSDYKIMNDKDVRMLGGLSLDGYHRGLEYWRKMHLFHQRVGSIPKTPIPPAQFRVIGYAAVTNHLLGSVVDYGKLVGIQKPHDELTVSDTVPGAFRYLIHGREARIVEIGIHIDEAGLWSGDVQKLRIHEFPEPNSARGSSLISSRLFQDLGLGGHYVPEFGVSAPLGPDKIPEKVPVRPADPLKALRYARANYDYKVQVTQKGRISSPHVIFNSLSADSHTIFEIQTHQTSQMIIPHQLHRMLFIGKQVHNGNFNVPQAGVNPSGVTPYHELMTSWNIKQL